MYKKKSQGPPNLINAHLPLTVNFDLNLTALQMSDDESDSPATLLTSSPASENGVAIEYSREGAAETNRRESRRSHCLFLSILVSVVAVVVVMVVVGLSVGLSRSQKASDLPRDPVRRAEALLAEFPVIDGFVVCTFIM